MMYGDPLVQTSCKIERGAAIIFFIVLISTLFLIDLFCAPLGLLAVREICIVRRVNGGLTIEFGSERMFPSNRRARRGSPKQRARRVVSTPP